MVMLRDFCKKKIPGQNLSWMGFLNSKNNPVFQEPLTWISSVETLFIYLFIIIIIFFFQV